MEPLPIEKLENLEEDISGLKEVWTELFKCWSYIDELKDGLLSVTPNKKIKEGLDLSAKSLNEVTGKLRTYEAYDKMRTRHKEYSKMNKMIMDMKTEAMKPRHWKILLKKININVGFNELTIG